MTSGAKKEHLPDFPPTLRHLNAKNALRRLAEGADAINFEGGRGNVLKATAKYCILHIKRDADFPCAARTEE